VYSRTPGVVDHPGCNHETAVFTARAYGCTPLRRTVAAIVISVLEGRFRWC
jgi:hypothetical protein